MLPYAEMIPIRLRILISAAVGILSGALCWAISNRFQLGSGDFSWAIHDAHCLLQGCNPYDTPYEQYPVTAAFFAFPFIHLSPALAGGAFYGVSSALLAFGLSRQGYYSLLVLLAYPYWAGMITAQWAPLIMAGAFFPILSAAALAKPQIGLPVVLTNFTWRGFTSCFLLLALSLILMPRWPIWWFHQLGNYQHFIPILVFPGILLLLALFRFRERDAILLLLTAAMPQRWFFDCFILWLIPKTRREMVWTVLLSWGAGIWRWDHFPHSFVEVGRVSVLFFYLPMLAVVLLRTRSVPTGKTTSPVATQ